MREEFTSNLTGMRTVDGDFDRFDDVDADSNVDNDEAVEREHLGYIGTPHPDTGEAAPDERSAEERIDALLASMATRRRILLGILDFCREPQPAENVNSFIDELQQLNFSVFSGADLCALLAQAGALSKTTAEGEPAPGEDVEPGVVVIDGVEYLEARPPVAIYWHTTPEGRAALEADRPLERLRDLFEKDAAYAVIYERILTLCTSDGGVAVSLINDAVDGDPLLENPRLYAPHFIEKLELCDALAWKKGWVTTDIGRVGLTILAAVVDPQSEPEAKEA